MASFVIACHVRWAVWWCLVCVLVCDGRRCVVVYCYGADVMMMCCNVRWCSSSVRQWRAMWWCGDECGSTVILRGGVWLCFGLSGGVWWYVVVCGAARGSTHSTLDSRQAMPSKSLPALPHPSHFISSSIMLCLSMPEALHYLHVYQFSSFCTSPHTQMLSLSVRSASCMARHTCCLAYMSQQNICCS